MPIYPILKITAAETSSYINADLSHIEDGPHVTAETSRRIACDCSIYGIIEDDEGEPLSIGRKTRSIPPAMRRALRARDQGCRFPAYKTKPDMVGYVFAIKCDWLRVFGIGQFGTSSAE